jgi:hypothetical protein
VCTQTDVDAYAACNQLCNAGPVVTVVNSLQPAPTPAGGTLIPGLYYLTAYTAYFASGVDAGPTSNTRQETAIVTAADPVGTIENVHSANGNPNDTVSYEYLASGTAICLTQTCPASGQIVSGYTASGGQLHVYETQSAGSGPYLADALYTLQQPADAGAPSFDSGAGDAGCTQPLSDAQAACTNLCNSGSVINAVGVAEVAPTPAGGTIPDGVYQLTARTLYEGLDSGADGGTLFTSQETLEFTTSAGVTIMEDVQSQNGQASSTLTLATFIQGTTMYMTEVCPVTGTQQQGSVSFTISGNTLTILAQRSSGVEADVYTKVP